jgi:hypothetical protein
MRIANALMLLVAILFTTAAGAELIRVVPLAASDDAVFNCGDRCKFRGALPKEPLRVRIIRGTKAELERVMNDPRYAAAGCIELYSTLVRPRRSQRAADLLDLKFYFSTDWLASGGANGQYVFVVERDDEPDGPAIDRTTRLRLPAGREGAKYFRAGVDVGVRAPVHTPQRKGFWAVLFGGAAAPAALMIPAGRARPARAARPDEMTMAMAEPEPVSEAALPAAAPRPTAAANCIDLQIDPQPVRFRSAVDASPPKRPTPTTVAEVP